VTWKVQEAPQVPLKPGARFTVRIAAQVQSGWHIYGLRPVEGGPIATRVWIADGLPVQLAGAVQGTDPITMHDPTFNLEVQAYEGEVVFTLPLRLSPTASDAPLRFNVNASYQACDNKICLPPRSVKLDVPVTVTK
jgi:thiol:disulfide interchange protein DsbD